MANVCLFKQSIRYVRRLNLCLQLDNVLFYTSDVIVMKYQKKYLTLVLFVQSDLSLMFQHLNFKSYFNLINLVGTIIDSGFLHFYF